MQVAFFFFLLIKLEAKESSIRWKIIFFVSRGQFSTRVGQVLASFDLSRINNLIDSMPKRIRLLKKAKGQRIEYGWYFYFFEILKAELMLKDWDIVKV